MADADEERERERVRDSAAKKSAFLFVAIIFGGSLLVIGTDALMGVRFDVGTNNLLIAMLHKTLWALWGAVVARRLL